MSTPTPIHIGWGRMISGRLKFAGVLIICLVVEFTLLAIRASADMALDHFIEAGSGKAHTIFKLFQTCFDATTLTLVVAISLIDLAMAIAMMVIEIIGLIGVIKEKWRSR